MNILTVFFTAPCACAEAFLSIHYDSFLPLRTGTGMKHFFILTALAMSTTATTEAFLTLPDVVMARGARHFPVAAPWMDTMSTIMTTTSTTMNVEDDDPTRWIPTYVQPRLPPKLALDVFCGNGDSTQEFCRRLSKEWKVIGVDTDARKITTAKERHPSLLFLTAPSLDVFSPATFDKIQIHTGRLLFVRDHATLARDLARLLKPGGTLEVYEFCPSHKFVHEIMMLEDHLRERYFPGWDISFLKEHFTLVEGHPVEIEKDVILRTFVR